MVESVYTWIRGKRLKLSIKPVGYGISTSTLTTLPDLKAAKELPQLYMKSAMERQLWEVLRRFSGEVRMDLDHKELEKAGKVTSFRTLINGLTVEVVESVIKVRSDKGSLAFTYEDVVHNVNKVFREIVNLQSRG